MSDKSDSPTANKGKTFQLICRGRGSFANRTWLFNSKSPSHFEIAHSDGYVIPNRTESIRNAIIRLLGDGRAYTSKLICAHLRHYTKGAVLNVMTDLKKRGILMRDSSKGRAPSFKVNFIQAEIHGYQRENTP